MKIAQSNLLKNYFYTPSVIALLLWVKSPVLSQEIMRVKHACNFAAAEQEGDLYTYDASKEAIAIVDKIMKVNVLPQNFIIKSADCANALATTEGKQRYILYSTAFLENFKKEASTQWAAYSVLAHEIGHHLSNHDLEESTPSVRKRFELEADRFAGGVLFKLGASLEQAQAGIISFSLTGESNTHPSKKARLEAVSVGWKQAEELSENKDIDNIDDINKEDSEEVRLYKRALAEKDPLRAIFLLDTLIELNGNFIDAYFLRGKKEQEKEEHMRNYDYAIEDFTNYIKARPKNPLGFYERGAAYSFIGKTKEAIADFNTAIKLNVKYVEAFFSRAWAKFKSDQYDGAIADFKQVIALKPDYPYAYYWLGNIKYGQAEYAEAIAYFDNALKVNARDSNAIRLRAASKQFSNDFEGAIADYNLFEKSHPTDFDRYIDRGICYQAINKHKEAIEDFDKAIQLFPETSDNFKYRGISFMVLGNRVAAYADFNKSINLTIMYSNFHRDIGCSLVKYKFYKEAIEWLDKALQKSPDFKSALDCKNEALSKIKN
jgi:tetratricopeptide (TPR) repeat protein